MRKIIIIISGLITFFVIALLFAINILFFREITPSVQLPKEAPAVEEPQLNIAIPSAAIPSTQEAAGMASTAPKRHRDLAEREAEAERIRAINRAQALAQLKAQESTPPSPTPAKIETQPPSEEELKELEKKGIVSY